MGRINWIDGAKGIAMLMVISVHLAQHVSFLPMKVFSFGAMGVQLFFLLSGYCLCMKLAKMTGGGKICLIIGRYRRLAPWYVVGIFVYAAWYWMLEDSTSLASFTIGNVAANILMVNAVVPSAQNTIVPGGWSISCIALFSFLFPFFLSASGQVQFKVLFVTSSIGLAISAIGYWFLEWSRQYSYCSFFNQFIVFVTGAMYFVARPRKLLKMNAWSAFCVFAGLLAMAVFCVMIDRSNSILYRHVLVALAFCFMLLLLERWQRLIPRWLEWIGRHSYEIFILHFIAIWAMARIIIPV